MATPNIVPRADSEGGLGIASKYWASAYIDTINATVIQSPLVDGDLILKADNGSGVMTAYLTLDGELGWTVASKDIQFSDSIKATFGSSVDMGIYHNSTNSYIENATGDLEIINGADNKDIIFKASTGTNAAATYLALDGEVGNTYAYKDMRFVDGVNTIFGTDGDMSINHDGTNMTMINSTGSMAFYQNTNDGDMVFYCDDGSGGLTPYLTLDGSEFKTTIATSTEILGRSFTQTDCVVTQNDATVTHTANAKIKVGMHVSGGGIPAGAFVASLNGSSNNSFEMSQNGGGSGVNTVTLTFSDPGQLTLSTANPEVTIGDILGRIDFQAPSEASGTDAILIGASIHAEVEETFASDNNSTALVFSTGTTTAPIERMRIDQDGAATFAGKITTGNQINVLGVQTGSDGAFGEIIFHNNGDSVATVASFRDGADNSGSLVFQTQNSGTFATALTLAANNDATFAGNLVVGASSSGQTALVTFNSEGGNEDGLKIQSRTNRAKLRVSDNDTNAYVVAEGSIASYGQTATAAATNISVLSAGNVGIGTTTPQRRFEVLSTSSGSVIDTHIGGTYSTTNYQGLSFGYAESANTSYRHSALVFERDDNGVGDATGNVHILNSVSGSGSTSAVLADAKLSLLKTGSAILAGIPFYSDAANNSMYTHDVSGTDDTATGNTAYGFGAMDAITTGDNNTAVGKSAGGNLSSGVGNVMIGGFAGDAIATGNYNVAVGRSALSAEDAHGYNVAVGTFSLLNQNAGVNAFNVGVGYGTGQNITTGVRNVIIGGSAGDGISLGSHNVAMGYSSLSATNAGSKSVAIGSGALSVQASQFTDETCDYNNDPTIGHDANTAILVGMRVTGTGIPANSFVKTKTSDTEFELGNAAGDDVSTTGGVVNNGTLTFTGGVDSHNTAVGYSAGFSVTTGINNTIMGGLAGDAINTGSQNVAVGKASLSSATTASDNVGLGHGALSALTTSARNVAIGTQALNGAMNTNSSTYNVAVGYQAGLSVTTGVQNTLIGGSAGDGLLAGERNVVVGYGALGTANGSESRNIAIGWSALAVLDNDGSNSNTALGYAAGMAVSTGANNTLIGSQAGDAITTGDNNIIIGATAAASAIGADNETVIGNTTTTSALIHGAMTNRAYTGTAEGGGIDATDAVSISVGEYNSEIVTSVFVDIGAGSIISSSDAGDVIGNDGLSSAYITKLTTAINGIVYRGEMICLEVPTTGDPDINLCANGSGTIAEDQGGEGAHVLINGGVATLAVKNDIAVPSGGIQDDFIYLTHGGTTAGTYDAGKFLIRFYGAKVTGL